MPTKDTAAEQGFREAWFRLIEDHRFKSAREYIDVKGSSLAGDKKHEFITETETHCQKYVQDALEVFLTALHNTVRVEGLRQKSDPELVALQLHDNDWYVRHARRILQERSVLPSSVPKPYEALEEIAFHHQDETRRLRGLRGGVEGSVAPCDSSTG